MHVEIQWWDYHWETEEKVRHLCHHYLMKNYINLLKNLTTRGCTIVKNDCLKTAAETPSLYGPPNPTFSWGKEYDEILRRIDASMESLKLAGWPPVFVFLFDEPWLLIDRMFELVSPILGKDCLLESSMYGWALSRSKAAAVANNIDGVDEATTTNTTTINTTINNAQKKCFFFYC